MAQLELDLAPPSALTADLVPHVNPRRSSPWDRITLGVDASPHWVVAALDRAERGDMTDLVLLNRRMEERLPGYAGALGQLKYPLTQAEVRVSPASKQARDKEMADLVRRVLDSDAFHLSKTDMLDAMGVGYSANEQQWADRYGAFVPVRWRHVRPDIIAWDRDGETPELYMGGGRRRPLAHGRWVMHRSRVRTCLPINAGLARTVATFYLFYNAGWLSYAAFADIFGLPLRVGYYAQGDSPADVAVLREALHAMGTDAVALIKKGMEYKIERAPMSGAAGSDRFFIDYLSFIKDEVIMAVLGQTMTSNNEGGSLAKAEVAERGKDLQVRALGFQLSATWRSDVVRPITDLNLGPDRDPPHVWLDLEDGDDISTLADGLVKFIDRGLPVLAADIIDRCGLQVPAKMPEDLLLHPEKSPPVSPDPEEIGEKAKSLARIIMRMCEAIDTEPDLDAVAKVMREDLVAAGYHLKRAA